MRNDTPEGKELHPATLGVGVLLVVLLLPFLIRECLTRRFIKATTAEE